LLAAATPAQIEQLMTSFGEAEVHVVYTVRDIARTLPAEWQQAVKGGSTITLDAFIEGVMNRFETGSANGSDDVPPVVGESHAVEKFTFLHDVPTVMERWAAYIPPRAIHLVTVPPPGSDPGLLWQRFCTATGIDPFVAQSPPRRKNESLGVVEAETLRRVNSVLSQDNGYDFDTGEWVRSHFVLPVIATRSPDKRITIRPAHHDWACQQADQLVKRLAATSYDVVGDLADLIPRRRSRRGVHPADLPADDIGAMAIGWVAKLLSMPQLAGTTDDAPFVDESPVPAPVPSDVLERPLLVATPPAASLEVEEMDWIPTGR
jgi:hypothetical protein